MQKDFERKLSFVMGLGEGVLKNFCKNSLFDRHLISLIFSYTFSRNYFILPYGEIRDIVFNENNVIVNALELQTYNKKGILTETHVVNCTTYTLAMCKNSETNTLYIIDKYTNIYETTLKGKFIQSFWSYIMKEPNSIAYSTNFDIILILAKAEFFVFNAITRNFLYRFIGTSKPFAWCIDQEKNEVYIADENRKGIDVYKFSDEKAVYDRTLKNIVRLEVANSIAFFEGKLLAYFAKHIYSVDAKTGETIKIQKIPDLFLKKVSTIEKDRGQGYPWPYMRKIMINPKLRAVYFVSSFVIYVDFDILNKLG